MGDQGFLFRCKDEQSLQVTTEQADTMKERCDYFRSVFAHGTTEAETYVLNKPDWMISTARSIVALLTKEKCVVEDYFHYECLVEAAEQVLLDIIPVLPSLVKNRNAPAPETISAMLHYLEQSKGNETLWYLKSSRKMEAQEWQHLLNKNIFVASSDDDTCTGIVMKLRSAPPGSSDASHFFQEIDLSVLNLRNGPITVGMGSVGMNSKIYHVKCKGSLGGALKEVRSAFCALPPVSSRKMTFTSEELSLRIPCNCLFAVQQGVDVIKQKTGVRGYMHTKSSLGYYLDGGGNDCCPTFIGSFKQLKEALNLIPENIISTYERRHDTAQASVKRCALRITAPAVDTLTRLLSATLSCEENPGTLGVDIEADAYFAVKTIQDMKLLLANLSSNSSVQMATGDSTFKIEDLTCPKGVF